MIRKAAFPTGVFKSMQFPSSENACRRDWGRPLKEMLCAAVFGLCFAVAAAVHALDPPRDPNDRTLEETPPAVQKTIQATIGTGEVQSITKKDDHSRVTYEVGFTKFKVSPDLQVIEDGKPVSAERILEKINWSRNFTVAENGALLSMEMALEETGAAQNAILELVGTDRLISIKKSFEEREKVLPFKVECFKDGKPFNFSVAPDGRFLGTDEYEAPEPRLRLRKHSP
jgi:hypothetical protein